MRNADLEVGGVEVLAPVGDFVVSKLENDGVFGGVAAAGFSLSELSALSSALSAALSSVSALSSPVSSPSFSSQVPLDAASG